MNKASQKGFGLRVADRTVLMIDGASTAAASRAVGWTIDFKKLRKVVQEQTHLVRARYFSLAASKIEDGEDGAERALKGLLDFLAYNGFVVDTRFVRPYDDGSGRTRLRGSMAVSIALKLVSDSPRIDHILLFTGDGSLAPAVEEAQRIGARVTVVGTMKGDNVSDGLRRQADFFVELDDLRDQIERERT